MSEPKTLAHSLTAQERTKDVLLPEKIPFSSLILPAELQAGLAASGFQYASPIQYKALPIGRCGFDLIVKSKSGTGKTLVFAIISLESVRLDKVTPQVLILAPTREIAVQIQEVIRCIGVSYEALSVECFIGGLPLDADKENCKRCHIAVGTPGRMRQLIELGHLKVDSVKAFVLDEADKLTEESFQDDINQIFNCLPDKKQIITCSATFTEEVKTFLEQYMRSPVVISVEMDSPLLLGVKQYVRLLDCPVNVVLQTKAKNEELLKIVSAVPFVQCIVFSNYQSKAESISNFLNRSGWSSIFMSAAQKQTDRLSSLSGLKDFKHKILVTTDLISRGIDVPNIDLVINYDVPFDAPTYLHRMGRAGRYGSTGHCINLAFEGKETDLLQSILGYIGGQTLSMPVVNEKYCVTQEGEKYLYGKLGDLGNYDKEIQEIRSAVVKKTKSSNKKAKKSKKEVVKEEVNNGDVSLVLSGLETPDLKEKDTMSLLAQLASEGAISDNSIVQKQPRTEEVLCKNKALIRVAQVLTGDEVSGEDISDLSQYLKSQDLHASNEPDLETHRTCAKSSFLDFLENIFAISYRSQVDASAPRWQDFLPDAEKPKLSDDYQFKMRADDEVYEYKEDCEDYDYDDDEVYDEDYDFEVEKEVQVNFAAAQRSNDDYSSMEWKPVEPGQEIFTKRANKGTVLELQKTENVQPSIHQDLVERDFAGECSDTGTYTLVPREAATYHQEYQKYFQHCSGNLWQNGLRFETVESFDTWFCGDWERQLSSVRSFVQSRIYLEEMSRRHEN